MRPAPRPDGAADLTIGLLLATGIASWTGLVLAQLGRFALPPVLLVAAVVGAGAWWALRRGRGGAPAEPASRWRRLDGPLVFAAAAALYLPGYDNALYGSDATVYLGTGMHIARNGALAVEEPLLARLPHRLEAFAFPLMSYNLHGTGPIARSPSGLVYERPDRRIYSTFSQLPSVWVAIGAALAGGEGARRVVPLIAAGAVMAFYVFVRRASGVVVGALAAALLAVAMPQLVFARVTMGECGAQFLLWGALVAYDRCRETGGTAPALAAGVGAGLAGLARPEYIAFLPVALVLLHAVRGEAERLPRLATAVAVLLFAHAVTLVLVVVPSHYRHVLRSALFSSGLAGDEDATSVGLVVAVAALGAAAALVAARFENATVGLRTRGALAAGLVIWAVAYATMGRSPSFGRGLPFLSYAVGWPLLVPAALGLPLLVGRWRTLPATRVACALGAVTAAHLFYDIHASPLPVWACRRLLPAVVPLLCVAAGLAVASLASRRALAALAAAIALGGSLWNSRPVLGAPYLEGSSRAVGRVASMVPRGALAFVDSALMPAELDAPLLLQYGRDAIQARGMTTGIEQYLFLFVGHLPDVPIYLIRPGTLVPPAPRPWSRLHFELVGEVRTAIRVLGSDDPAGVPFHVRVYRVVVERT